jgi:hypothetical protein
VAPTGAACCAGIVHAACASRAATCAAATTASTGCEPRRGGGKTRWRSSSLLALATPRSSYSSRGQGRRREPSARCAVSPSETRWSSWRGPTRSPPLCCLRHCRSWRRGRRLHPHRHRSWHAEEVDAADAELAGAGQRARSELACLATKFTVPANVLVSSCTSSTSTVHSMTMSTACNSA